MSEKDAEIERLEIRVTELEQQVDSLERAKAVLQGELSDTKSDLAGVLKILREGRTYVRDLVERHFRDADDYDAQLRRVCDWVPMLVPGEEGE